MTKFPDYAGYLLVNDDAMLKLWDLDRKVWFNDKAWGTFTPHEYGEQIWFPRIMRKRPPFGKYWWSWYNLDSGTVRYHKNATRSNFDAALDAMNELCEPDTKITQNLKSSQVEEFCTNRTRNILRPFYNSGGKADILYVPGTELGSNIAKAMTLFGEHDVMMEIAYPMVLSVVAQKEEVLEMPLCDGSATELDFENYFELKRKEGQGLDCPTIHPIKFGKNSSLTYWQDLLQKSCSQCTLLHSNEGYWRLI